MEDFEVIRSLGQGAFARCVLARRKADGNLYAIKQFKVPFSDLKAKEQAEAVAEVSVLAKLSHVGIIRYFTHWIGPVERGCPEEVLHIVTEFADGGTLADFLITGDYDEEMIWSWLVQLVDALHFLHSQRVLHRDLKPANVFVKRHTRGLWVKLGDFGLAKSLTSMCDMAVSMVGTPYYLSPEVVQSIPYDGGSDAWSLGCILFELLTGRRPFEGDNIASLAFNITSGSFSCAIPDTADPELADIARRLLALDPAKRLTIAELRERPSVCARLEVWQKDEDALSNNSLVREDPGPLSPGFRSSRGGAHSRYRADVGFLCRFCGKPSEKPPAATSISSFLRLSTGPGRLEELRKCLSEERCLAAEGCSPGSIAILHAACRTGLRLRLKMKEADMPPAAHTCWDLAAVADLVTSGDEWHTPTACAPCLNSLIQVFQCIATFQQRCDAERAMRTYIRESVWPGVPDTRQHVMRAVLHQGPFRLRTPKDLEAGVHAVMVQILTCLEAELAKRKEPPLTDIERGLFLDYAYRHSPDDPSIGPLTSSFG